jgi:hypothetical protein
MIGTLSSLYSSPYFCLYFQSSIKKYNGFPADVLSAHFYSLEGKNPSDNKTLSLGSHSKQLTKKGLGLEGNLVLTCSITPLSSKLCFLAVITK